MARSVGSRYDLEAGGSVSALQSIYGSQVSERHSDCSPFNESINHQHSFNY